MQIEMTTEQFKKRVFAIRDKYNFMLEKHNRLMSYLKSIKPEVDKKVEEYNDNLRQKISDKYSSITKEDIIKECFTKEVKVEYVESGWLWWHKAEKVEEDFYTLSKHTYDNLLRVQEKDFTASVTVNSVVIEVPISETILLSQLEKDTRLDELHKLKEKLAQIEKLLGE